MKNFLLIAGCISLFLLQGCAQTRNGIQKTYAFFMQSFPGNIPVDENGKPMKGLDTLRMIYLECTGKSEPVIESVEYKGRMYTASVYAADESPVIPGQIKGTRQNILIRPARGNRIWRVELTPTEETQTSKSNKIILKGKKDGRSFTRVVESEVELQAPIRA